MKSINFLIYTYVTKVIYMIINDHYYIYIISFQRNKKTTLYTMKKENNFAI
jgi:hypothetical protein